MGREKGHYISSSLTCWKIEKLREIWRRFYIPGSVIYSISWASRSYLAKWEGVARRSRITTSNPPPPPPCSLDSSTHTRPCFSLHPKKLLRAPPSGVWRQQPVRAGRRRGRCGDRGPQGVRGSVREGRADPFRRRHSLLSELIFWWFPFGVAALNERRGEEKKEERDGAAYVGVVMRLSVPCLKHHNVYTHVDRVTTLLSPPLPLCFGRLWGNEMRVTNGWHGSSCP